MAQPESRPALRLVIGDTIEAGGYKISCYRSGYGGLIGEVFFPDGTSEHFRGRHLAQATERAADLIAAHLQAAAQPTEAADAS